ncbi:hypothetical protein GCM10020221_16260 [Streptomyces thioluteus]|uniref:Uncharacterized protein n=1 Tax=Streptomyces thioluteus TaxID=66431 RepID=A0ABN3WP38_STRTU
MRAGVHRPNPRGPDVFDTARRWTGEGALSSGLRTAVWAQCAHTYTVAGQFRISTGFPCGDSEDEHTSSGDGGVYPHMLCRRVMRWSRNVLTGAPPGAVSRAAFASVTGRREAGRGNGGVVSRMRSRGARGGGASSAGRGPRPAGTDFCHLRPVTGGSAAGGRGPE